jgi:hypothetical protein
MVLAWVHANEFGLYQGYSHIIQTLALRGPAPISASA